MNNNVKSEMLAIVYSKSELTSIYLNHKSASGHIYRVLNVSIRVQFLQPLPINKFLKCCPTRVFSNNLIY